MTSETTIVVIDDDRAVLKLIQKALAEDEYHVVTALQAGEGLSAIRDKSPALVFLDVVLPDANGLDLLQSIRTIDPRLPVIFVTASTESDTAIEAMQRGAYDYISKPLDVAQLRAVAARAANSRRLMSVPVALGAEPLRSTNGGELAFIGCSPAMLEVFKAVGRVAEQDVPVLVRGASGTGKELVARAIYQHSRRSGETFVAVNCAALPESLLESELFGHEKGAFTGAQQRRIGKFEQCNGGTIFLDEIGDMAPSVQGKVLRVLQEQQFERVGGNESIQTDVRIISATNQPLEEMVEQGDFRADLVYRLNGVTIELPPLRERDDDIRLLAQHFLAEAVGTLDKPDIDGLSPDALEELLRYEWPGNVRELRAAIRQAVLNTTGTVIPPEALPPEIRGEQSPFAADAPVTETTKSDRPVSDLASVIEPALAAGETDLYARALEAMERYVITRTLQQTEGNRSRAAEILGITRGKIRDRIATFDITLDTSVGIKHDDAATVAAD